MGHYISSLKFGPDSPESVENGKTLVEGRSAVDVTRRSKFVGLNGVAVVSNVGSVPGPMPGRSSLGGVQRPSAPSAPRPFDSYVPQSSGLPEYLIPGVTMSMVARATGLTLGGISRIFNGHRAPKLENLIAIADYLTCTTDDVLAIIRTRSVKHYPKSITGLRPKVG